MANPGGQRTVTSDGTEASGPAPETSMFATLGLARCFMLSGPSAECSSLPGMQQRKQG